MKKNIRIAIIGAGSIGCYIGGHLLQSIPSAELHFFGRQKIKNAISQNNLNIINLDGQLFTATLSMFAFSEELNKVQDVDIYFICVKSHDTETVAKQLVGKISNKSIIVSLQNGVKNPEILRKVLPAQEIIGGIIPFNVIHSPGGTFRQTTSGKIALEKTNSSKSIVDALSQCGLPCYETGNLKGTQWTKLIMNLNNAINALVGIPLVEELNSATCRKIIAACIQEALFILKSANIKPSIYGPVIPQLLPTILSLPTPLFRVVAKRMIAMDAAARSSMYDDLNLQRKTEIEFIQGEIDTIAKQSGQAAPINKKIMGLIHKAEQAALGSPKYTPTELASLLLNNR